MGEPRPEMKNNFEPLDNVGFWRYRLKVAKKIEDSIYICSNWDQINRTHTEIWEKYIRPSHGVLDAGCGYGRIKNLVKCSHYIGVDGSPDLVEKAIELHGNSFLVGDIRDLEFDDNEFDWSLCIGVIGFGDVPNKERWIQISSELTRVSKLGVIYLSMTRPYDYGLHLKSKDLVEISL